MSHNPQLKNFFFINGSNYPPRSNRKTTRARSGVWKNQTFGSLLQKPFTTYSVEWPGGGDSVPLARPKTRLDSEDPPTRLDWGPGGENPKMKRSWQFEDTPEVVDGEEEGAGEVGSPLLFVRGDIFHGTWCKWRSRRNVEPERNFFPGSVLRVLSTPTNKVCPLLVLRILVCRQELYTFPNGVCAPVHINIHASVFKFISLCKILTGDGQKTNYRGGHGWLCSYGNTHNLAPVPTPPSLRYRLGRLISHVI